MARHTSEIVANIIPEAKYGSGSTGGAAAYEKHAFVDDEGDPMQSPFSGIDLPMATINRAFVKQIGGNMGSRMVFDNGILTPEVTFDQYVQDDRWIDSLINGYDAGAIPKDGFSHAIHWENGDHLEDVFGVMPVRWRLDLDRGNNEGNQPFPKQSTTVSYFNTVTSTEEYGSESPGGFNTAQPLVNSNFAIVLDKDGESAIDLVWKKLTVDIAMITNKEGAIGQEESRYPFALDYEISVKLDFYTYNAVLIEPKVVTASLQDLDFTLTMTGLTEPALKIDNLFVKSSNVATAPEHGLFLHSMELVPGDTFVHTANLTLT